MNPYRAGIRALAPLMVAAFPFGLVYGVAVTQSDVDRWAGASASWIILAGAAQLTLIDLRDDATWLVAVGTALVVNLRFLLYSLALAPAFAEFPARWRYSLPYLMTDQAAGASLAAYEHEADPGWRRRFYFGGGLAFASVWWLGTVVGIVFGAQIPDTWQIEFAFPLMFIALLVPPITTRPMVVAALVGGLVTILARDLPNGLNIVAGAVAGIAVGNVVPDPNETRDPA